MKGVNVKLNYNQSAIECRDKLVDLCNKWEMDDSDRKTMTLEVDDYFMSTIYSVVKILGEIDTKNGNCNYKTEETQFGTKTSHPSYGTLAFRRCTRGAGTALFGSSIEHRDTISMTLYHADMTRGLHSDWIGANREIAEVEMSYSQFAEAITSMNTGNGVPVTIRWTEKDGEIPPCDFVSKREQFVDEFKKKREKATEESQQIVADVAEMFEQKKNLTKADKDSILRKLSKLSQNIGCNMDFIADQFNKQMDQTVMEAKGEIEAFCQNKISSIANAALVERKEELAQLENPVEVK